MQGPGFSPWSGDLDCLSVQLGRGGRENISQVESKPTSVTSFNLNCLFKDYLQIHWLQCMNFGDTIHSVTSCREENVKVGSRKGGLSPLLRLQEGPGPQRKHLLILPSGFPS